MLEIFVNFGYEIFLSFVLIIGLFITHSTKKHWNENSFITKKYISELCFFLAILLLFMCILFWNAEILYYLEERRELSTYWYDNYSGVYVYNEYRHMFFYNSREFISTPLLFFCKILVIIITSCCLIYASTTVLYSNLNRVEYPFFFLTALLAMLLLIDSNHLLYSYLSLELLNFSVYLLLGGRTLSSLANEACQRYFVYSSYASALFLLGLAILYGLCGSLNIDVLRDILLANQWEPASHEKILSTLGLVLLYIGLLFKLSIFPFHFWVPEVYEGSPLASVLFLATAVKLAILTLFLKVTFSLAAYLSFFLPLLQILALVSIIYGTIAGLYEYRLKRFLGYSTISNMGFIILGFSLYHPLGFSAALLYFTIYLLTMVAFFGLLMLFSIEINLSKENISLESLELKEIFSLQYYNKHYSYLLSFTVLILSLAGIPPLAGFFIKFSLLQACFLSGNYFLGFLVFLFSVLSLGFYLRLLRLLYVSPLQLSFQKKAIKSLYFSCQKRPILAFFIISLIIFFLITYMFLFHSFLLWFFDFLVQTSDYLLCLDR